MKKVATPEIKPRSIEIPLCLILSELSLSKVSSLYPRPSMNIVPRILPFLTAFARMPFERIRGMEMMQVPIPIKIQSISAFPAMGIISFAKYASMV